MAPLDEEMQCGAIKTQSQQDRGSCSLLTINRVFLFCPPRGWGKQGEEGRVMPFFFIIIIFQYIFRLIPYCCLRSTVNKCVPPPLQYHTPSELPA